MLDQVGNTEDRFSHEAAHLQVLARLLVFGCMILHVMQGANSEGGCEEEIVKLPQSVEKQGEIHITTDRFIHFEDVLFGGELNVLPSESKDDSNDNKIYLYVKPEKGEPKRNASYSFRNLTDISFTVEGVTDVTIWLLNPKAYRWWSRQTAYITYPGQKERVDIDLEQFQTVWMVVILDRHDTDVVKIYDMTLKACRN